MVQTDNISAGQLISMLDMIATLKELHPGWSGEAGPGLDYRGFGAGFYFRLSLDKARKEIGFTPKFDFRSAAIDYAEKALAIRSGS